MVARAISRRVLVVKLAMQSPSLSAVLTEASCPMVRLAQLAILARSVMIRVMLGRSLTRAMGRLMMPARCWLCTLTTSLCSALSPNSLTSLSRMGCSQREKRTFCSWPYSRFMAISKKLAVR